MTTSDARGGRPTLRLRAADAELHGEPGGTVTFRLSLFNGLRNSEVFDYAADPLDEDFECHLSAPGGPVAPGQTVVIEVEVKIPEGGVAKPGEYAFRVAAVLRRDPTIGVAQDCFVVVGEQPVASSPSLVPWVAGGIGALAIGVALLFVLAGSGDSGPLPIVQGVNVAPTQSIRSSLTPGASAIGTPAPTETRGLGVGMTDSPTETPVPANTAPTVRIASPPDGQLYCPAHSSNQGVYTIEIPLQGEVSDDQDGQLPNDQLSWTFSINGQEPQFFANSAIVSLELHVSAETFETVDVVLQATDSEGLSNEASIRLLVGGPASDACLNPATTPLFG